MKENIIAQRYAEAFLKYAASAPGLERAVEELKQLKLLLCENTDFHMFLENVNILRREKSDVIDNVLQGFSEQTKTFLKLLIKKDRIENLFAICDYVRSNYTLPDTADALLKTSYPLDIELIQHIKERLENRMKKRLKLHIELDPDLLGGVQVTVGNLIFDGSIRRQLADLKNRLTKVRIV